MLRERTYARHATKVANHAQFSEPEEAIVFPDSTPIPSPETDLDITEIDISGTVLHKYDPIYELNLVQLNSDEEGMANVEIDDGSDNGETSLG